MSSVWCVCMCFCMCVWSFCCLLCFVCAMGHIYVAWNKIFIHSFIHYRKSIALATIAAYNLTVRPCSSRAWQWRLPSRMRLQEGAAAGAYEYNTSVCVQCNLGGHERRGRHRLCICANRQRLHRDDWSRASSRRAALHWCAQWHPRMEGLYWWRTASAHPVRSDELSSPSSNDVRIQS